MASTSYPIEMEPELASTKSPIINCVLAGGMGGLIGDTSMHSLDTIKTRQQGFPQDLKYRKMVTAYRTVFKLEGLRGLYGGYTAAMCGSFPSTAIFFGVYEFTKRKLIGQGINDTVSYLIAGVFGDLASSVIYVPSEVLKTRLQLKGVHNNPYTAGYQYNYRGLFDGIRSIVKNEGWQTLAFGYKETLLRDLPFSALQFAFYERFRKWAIYYNRSPTLSVFHELLTGAAAGGLAGIITTPLDVVKTRIQTGPPTDTPKITSFSTVGTLKHIYKSEGPLMVFSGVGPRFIWTSVQSSIMLLLYHVSLRHINQLTESK